MKKIVQCIYAGFTLLLFSNTVKAQNTLIHYWDFNDTTIGTHYMPNIPPVRATYSVLDTSKVKFYYEALSGSGGNSASYLDVTSGDVMNARMGSGAGNCIRMRTPCDSMQGVYYIPSTGYHNIVITFETQASNVAGDSNEYYSISLDSGATWQTTGLSMTSLTNIGTNWQLVTIYLTPVADNNPKLVFRVQQSGPVDAHNDRYDNLTVESSPSVYVLSAPQVSANELAWRLFPNPANDLVILSVPENGEKTITVYNTVGQVVFTANSIENEISFSTSTLAKGSYFVKVEIGVLHSAKQFVKN